MNYIKSFLLIAQRIFFKRKSSFRYRRCYDSFSHLFNLHIIYIRKLNLFKQLFKYLKVQNYTLKRESKESSSMCQFNPQMFASVVAVLEGNQEPRASSRSALWVVAGVLAVRPSPTAFTRQPVGSWVKSTAAGI